MKNLQELILTLTPNEKKLFVKHARQHLRKHDSKILTLFSETNAALNKKQKTEDVFEKYTSSQCSYLYNKLLSFFSKNIQSDIEKQITDIKNEAVFLSKKGLSTQAAKKFATAKKLAKEYRLPFYCLDLSLSIRRLSRQQYPNDLKKTIKEEVQNSYKQLKLINDHIESINLWDLYLIADDNEKIERSKNLPPTPVPHDSFEGSYYSYLTYFEKEKLNNNNEKQLLFLEKAVTLFEENPKIQEREFDSYLMVVRNYINYCTKLELYSKVKEQMEKLRTKSKSVKSPLIQALIAKTITLNELPHLILSKETKFIIYRAYSIKKMLQKFKNFINPFDKALIRSYVAIAFFYEKKLDETINWGLESQKDAKNILNLNSESTANRKELLNYLKTSRLSLLSICYFEKEDFKKMRSWANKTRGFIEANPMYYKEQIRAIPNTLLRIRNKPSMQQELLQDLKEKIHDTPGMEEFNFWLEEYHGIYKKNDEEGGDA